MNKIFTDKNGNRYEQVTEAERLAQKQPGDIFRVLKVVGECSGKVNVEWK